MSPLDAAARRELERVFAEEAPDRLLRLAAALEGAADGDGADAARFEAHTLRGAAAIAGRGDLAALCREIEGSLAEDQADPEALRAAARRVRDAAGVPGAEQRSARLLDRLVPRRLMSQLALILFLAVLPGFGIAIYDVVHGRSAARQRVAAEAMSDSLLVGQAAQQVVAGGERMLAALAQAEVIRHGTPRSCSAQLARLAARLAPYARLGVVTHDGRVVCASSPPPPGLSAATLPVFRQIEAMPRFTVGTLTRDPAGKGFVVPIGEPLGPNALGASQIGALVNVSGIQRLIDGVRLRPGSAVLVVDTSGRVLARRPDAALYVGGRTDLAAIRAVVAGSGSAEREGVDRVRRLFAYHRAGPWYVGVGIPLGPEYAKLTHELLVELLVIILLGSGGLVLGLLGARQALARPLRSLVGTAHRLGSGDLAARSEVVPHGSELGELAVAIDAMAAALQERTAERERAVADLSALTAELEERVEARTTDLETARDEADRANLAKTAFLSRLSHELRTPLNAIRGFSQILTSGELPPDKAEAAAHIVAGAEHMTHLVEDLLDTARIEAGQFRVELEPVAVAEVVGGVVELSRGTAADLDVVLAPAEVEPGLGVEADHGRLRQALLNLVTNAIVYNRRGGSVTVRAARGVPGRVVIDVLDTGEGIPADRLERLFVPYDRLGRGSETPGLGLGLSLSRRLVEAMGGTITVESEVGVGTRFAVELAEADVPAGVADSGGPAAAAGRGAKSVLYIEDNATSMKLVELLLRGRGVTFHGATTAADGLQAARELRPDLILLDLHLPDASGEDVLRDLRSEPSLRAVPVVMLSAQAGRETTRRLLEAGADDYLTKPIEVDRAADTIERLLRRS